MRWLGGKEWAHNCDLLPSFYRWSLIGMRSTIVFIPNEGDVLKVPSIHMAALLCILPRIFNRYNRGTLLSSQTVDLVSLYFIFHFLSFSFYVLIFLFLEHRVRVRSQDTENKVEGSRTNDIIQHGYHMLIPCSIHGYLG